MLVIQDFFLANPLVAIFFVLATGYLVGKIKLKSFTLGSTVGVLMMALLVGQLGIFTFPDPLKSIFFDLFIFIIGFEVGPSFLSSLKKSGLKLVLQSLFFAVTALVLGSFLFKLFHLTPGASAGILAGALTQSSAIGTANSAISQLAISDALKETYQAQVAIGYAITYVFGTVGVVIFIKSIAPKILRLNLKEATNAYIVKEQFEESGTQTNTKLIPYESYVLQEVLTAVSIEKFESFSATFCKIEKVLRGSTELTFTNQTLLKTGDKLILVGCFSPESKLDFTLMKETKTFDQLALFEETLILKDTNSVALLKEYLKDRVMLLQSEGQENLPLEDLKSGSIVTLLGPKHTLKKVMKDIGYEVANENHTDIPYLSFGLIVGMLLGTIVFPIAGIPISFGAGGGCLFSGLFFGWCHHKNPTYGNIPSSTRWFLKSVGLNFFIGCVGLEAGAKFIPALKEMGLEVLLLGILMAILPHLAALLFGHFILKMDLVENLGALSGMGTLTAALNSLNEETETSVFGLFYTPTYALGNILLTLLGPAIVFLMG